MTTLFHPITERARRVYHRVRHAEPVWLYIINREGRRRFTQEARRPLAAAQAAVVDGLRAEGIALTHVADLAGEATWRELREYFNALVAQPEVQAKMQERRGAPASRGDKYFNVKLWDPPVVLDLAVPTLRFVLSEAVTDVVHAYMQMWTKFRGMHFWASMPVPAGADPYASQNWHRDPEDRKLVKTFIYFNDVDDQAGPFTYVKGSQVGGKWRDFYPQIPPIGRYPPAGAVEKSIPAGDVIAATGRAGTVIFCDTSGLHKGGYCKSKVRFINHFAFASAASVDPPINYVFPPGFSWHTLPSRIRYALENKR